MHFNELNLCPETLRALEELGFSTPTPIQEKAIPTILNGNDLRASAQTGTGKTAAYILPALNKFDLAEEKKGPYLLVLVPTRELAMQVATETKKFSKYHPKLKTVCIFGGDSYHVQNRQLAKPYHILIATPGRLIDHMERGRIKLNNIKMLVLDEADRMLDMGFIGPVEQIAEATSATRQTLMFSATFTKNVLKLSKTLLQNPIELQVAQENSAHKNIEQRLLYTDSLDHKNRLLNHLLNNPEINQTIVFTSSKRHADTLAEELFEQGLKASALHGDMNQRQRTRTILRFRRQEIRILIATDVAARGIDVQSISHVINFDLPRSAEDYVHRIGRTGRAGASGIAISFASSNENHLVKKIEKLIGQNITSVEIPGFEPEKRKSLNNKSNFRHREFFRKKSRFKK